MASAEYLVFISHSSKNRWIAGQIARLIEERGIQTFLDEKDLHGGDSILESIRKNIEKCDELIVLVDQYSVDRPWVLLEIGMALGLKKRIVPIIDKILPEQMPDFLVQLKAIDLNDLDHYLEELGKRAKRERQ